MTTKSKLIRNACVFLSLPLLFSLATLSIFLLFISRQYTLPPSVTICIQAIISAKLNSKHLKRLCCQKVNRLMKCEASHIPAAYKTDRSFCRKMPVADNRTFLISFIHLQAVCHFRKIQYHFLFSLSNRQETKRRQRVKESE